MIHRDPYGLIRSADEGDVSEGDFHNSIGNTRRRIITEKSVRAKFNNQRFLCFRN